MDTLTGQKKSFQLYDKSLSRIETPQGTLTLVSVFLPFFVEMLLTNSMGTVNTLVLSHYSDEAVASVGAANQLMGMIFTFYTVISTGASIFISHRLGAKQKEAASDAAFTSIFCGLALSLVVGTVLSFFAHRLMEMMQLSGQVLEDAAVYFRICISFSFFQALISSISAIFRSYGLPKIAVWVSLFMNFLNAVLNVIVIFRPFETPLHGVSGIAITNVISRGAAFVLIVVCLLRSSLELNFRKKNLKTLKCIGNILHIGLPGGISSLSYSTSQVVSTSILAVLGTAAISTKIYLSTIFFYVYVIGMSLGMATSLIIGWMTGAGEYDKAYRLNMQNLRIAVLLNAAGSTLIFLFGEPLMGLFTDSAEIMALARPILFIDIFVEIGRAFNQIEDNSLRGAGDVIFSMIVS
ncbi:MAG: MATE family efflux transporter, partial [Eisenbergiella porci]|uniref:MATE family efflux transporter n=1 Tax=Eisenbergiella porci TaxID=2652274 RepID=UPI002A7592BA